MIDDFDHECKDQGRIEAEYLPSSAAEVGGVLISELTPGDGRYDRDEVFVPVEALPSLIDWLQRATVALGCPPAVG